MLEYIRWLRRIEQQSIKISLAMKNLKSFFNQEMRPFLMFCLNPIYRDDKL